MEESGEGTETKAESNTPPARKREETSQPDVPLRDNMVDLATRFLTNSRVQSSPMDQRRAFLKKKGISKFYAWSAVCACATVYSC